jgi:hypothetical protein
MPVARTFRFEDEDEDETVTYAKGDLVRCDDCHEMPDE